MLIRAKTPLRLSFAGGGTDIPPYPQMEGGCVLSATINKHAYGSLSPRLDNSIRVESVDYGVSLNYRLDDPLIYDGKLDLVKGAIARLLGSGSSGLDLLLRADTPPGSGLGASSALMVTLVGLFQELNGVSATDYETAKLAYTIERKDLGISGGLQDQYACTFGGFNFIEFLGDEVVVNSLKISQDTSNELELNLLLCYTGKTRLSARIIDDQVAQYNSKDKTTLKSLRRLKELTIEMKNALLQRRFSDFGSLMHEEWLAKRSLSEKISTPGIDELYALALASGASGGKIAGAGGGGYLLLFCDFERKHRLAELMTEAGCAVTDFAFESSGLQTWRVN